MSRTRKDAPYWVRVNRTATHTWHNHSLFGQVRYSYRHVKDSNDNLVYDDVPFGLTAGELASHTCYSRVLTDHYGWECSHGAILSRAGWRREMIEPYIPRSVFIKAKNLRSAGYPNEYIQLGTQRRARQEKVVLYEYKDYCTEGELDTNQRHGLVNPCTPDIITTKAAYVSNMPGPKHSYSRARYSHERVLARDTLKHVAKGYNSGEDVEDFEDDIHPLTNQHRHSMNWDLW